MPTVRRPADAPWSVVDVERLLIEGRYGDPRVALAELDAEAPGFRERASAEDWLIALYARASLLLHTSATRAEVIGAWTGLEQAAMAARQDLWVNTARALRALARLEHGEPGAALGDLARIELLDPDDTPHPYDSINGMRMLDAVAAAFSRARITDRAEQARAIIESTIEHREPMDRAAHWSAWAGELAARSLEPVARGSSEPEPRQLALAVERAQRVVAMEVHTVPAPLRRGAASVLALALTYRGQAPAALELLGSDAFGEPLDLTPPESQLAVIAALRAHTIQGSYATARSLDDGAGRTLGSLPTVILEVCRARERVALERRAGGDTQRSVSRVNDLLVRLAWQSMELLSQTARQAMEHHVLLTESRTDPLTGVGNRRAYDEVLHSMLRYSRLPLGMVLIDIDQFKAVNEEFTRAVGDTVLRRVSEILRDQLAPNDKLVRYGGDEFIALIEGAGDAEAAATAARLTSAVNNADYSRVATHLKVQVTAGHAALYALSGRRPGADADRLLRRADESLLAAKGAKGNLPPAAAPRAAAASTTDGAAGLTPWDDIHAEPQTAGAIAGGDPGNGLLSATLRPSATVTSQSLPESLPQPQPLPLPQSESLPQPQSESLPQPQPQPQPSGPSAVVPIPTRGPSDAPAAPSGSPAPPPESESLFTPTVPPTVAPGPGAGGRRAAPVAPDHGASHGYWGSAPTLAGPAVDGSTAALMGPRIAPLTSAEAGAATNGELSGPLGAPIPPSGSTAPAAPPPAAPGGRRARRAAVIDLSDVENRGGQR